MYNLLWILDELDLFVTMIYDKYIHLIHESRSLDSLFKFIPHIYSTVKRSISKISKSRLQNWNMHLFSYLFWDYYIHFTLLFSSVSFFLFFLPFTFLPIPFLLHLYSLLKRCKNFLCSQKHNVYLRFFARNISYYIIFMSNKVSRYLFSINLSKFVNIYSRKFKLIYTVPIREEGQEVTNFYLSK